MEYCCNVTGTLSICIKQEESRDLKLTESLNVYCLFSVSYDNTSSAPTTDMSFDFTGTETPPINMPRVIPAPYIPPSPAGSEGHLPSRVYMFITLH